MDTYNDALTNQCDYAKEDDIKRILLNFTTLAQLSLRGNMSAYVILMDIQNAVNDLVSKKQKHCVIKCLVRGWTQQDVAQELNISQIAVNAHIKKAVENISKYLTNNGGDTYV